MRIVTYSLLLLTFLLPACTTQQGASLNQRTTPLSVDQAYGQIKAAIESNPKLSVMAEIDHRANASRADLELPPTRVIIFGNPNMGTPLMAAAPTTAIDLPQKMLVYQNEQGRTSIAYNEPAYLARRHGITGQKERLEEMSAALDKIAGKGLE